MSPIRLLLVEDDEAIAAGLEYSLEQEGFSVTRQARVDDALSVLHSESFDLALLDLSLPDGSGYDICHYIKKERDMPVVFLTARDDEGNVVMGLDMGADDYIVKPFRLRELVIEDTGIGIAAEDLPRICEKGFTGYNGRTDKKATGLGLYLCRRILYKLSHTLSIESQPGKGTRVSIGLESKEIGLE